MLELKITQKNIIVFKKLNIEILKSGDIFKIYKKIYKLICLKVIC